MTQFDGSYVLVYKSGKSVVITQDFIGSYGIYIYRNDGYFAVSNSFQYLVERVRPKRPVTLNLAYASSFQTVDLCSVSYSDTLVSEITLAPRNSYIRIDVQQATLDVVDIPCEELTVYPDSQEGIEILDRWFQKWSNVIRWLADATDGSLTFDLTGGFDSRMVFSLLIASGVGGDQIRLCSTEDTIHTFSEDFAIASKIADYFGFTLNVVPERERRNRKIPLTLEKSIENSMYAKWGVHKQPHFKLARTEKLDFRFTGSGGECLRDYWSWTRQEYAKNQQRRCFQYPPTATNRLSSDTLQIIQESFDEIAAKYGDAATDATLSQLLYRETRCRFHFGRDAVESYLINGVRCTPLIDRDLYKLRTSAQENSDRNFLVALIWTRYCPDLLTFPFQGKRGIEEETLRYAAEINERFPYRPAPIRSRNEELDSNASLSQSLDAPLSANPLTTAQIADYIRKTCLSSKCRFDFEQLYDGSIYDYCLQLTNAASYEPLQWMMAILAIDTVSHLASSNEQMPSGLEYLKSLQTYGSICNRPTLPKAAITRELCTARIDCKNLHEGTGDGLRIEAVEGGFLSISEPLWFIDDRNNHGFVFETYQGKVSLTFESLQDGELRISLKAPYLRTSGERNYSQITYTSLVINEEEKITDPVATWHDSPKVFTHPLRKGERVVLRIQWKPYMPSNAQSTTAAPPPPQSNPISKKAQSQVAKRLRQKLKLYTQPIFQSKRN